MITNQPARLYASFPILSGAHCTAIISLSALRHNYRLLCQKIGDTPPICVVKADAYGHGAQTVARTLYEEGCRHFAVSALEEALAVREVVADADILILGSILPKHVPILAKHRIATAVFSKDMALALSQEAKQLGLSIGVHIKLDTGMNRLGFAAYDEASRTRTLSELAEVCGYEGLEIHGVFSHFATADDPQEQGTEQQAERFTAMLENMESRGLPTGMKHLCNTAGALRYPRYRMDAVRLGIALYGYLPYEDADLPLLPVMRLCSAVTHIHTLPKGEHLGYGGTFAADSERKIATVSIGYADGFIRAYSGANVTVHTGEGDFSAPVVGRICMDQCMLDVTGIPVECGNEVTLFGDSLESVLKLAEKANTIPYEVLCLISARVPRVEKE